MSDFDELVGEAESLPIEAWDFSPLDGRATEERSLSEFLLGPLPPESKRDPDVERRAAEDAGLVVQALDVERPRTVFFDVGAVVYFLRVVPWIVPGFSVARFREPLRELHRKIERDGAFETTASRMLVEATKPHRSRR